MFHPEKLKLVLTSVPFVASVVFAASPFEVVAVGAVPEVAPLALYVIVVFHCAYKVVLAVGIKVVEPTA